MVAHSARHVLLYIYLVLSIVVAVSILSGGGGGAQEGKTDLTNMLEREIVYPLALFGRRVDR